ncbi:PhaM family polyhydroxyalkanoate granule multifunctional regulatory protein [Duganella sp. HH101]|uniref:PhaM family polyhydroxyalkanoate granule multifunctional regulatory protein n=1 Tax=Duganella sp. HH101 TaxID=1781066 RepID=UPI001E3F3784|nr:PhaM family polyhydroxyalkanoate granule multifunctional regulatory protein [Duganella sp. HH101]
MTDTLDFVKNLWGSMSVPGLTAPTLSVEELDKKISDLKAVETWLNLNMSMLRGSIQALEVQRGTIATLKSVGASLAAAVNQPHSSDHKSIFDANPYASAFFHHAREADKDKDKDKDKAAAPAPAPAAAPAEAAAAKPDATASAKPAADTAAAQMANPAVWWNMLQDQFKQAVSTAMASESMMASAAARASDTAAKFATAATPPAAKAKPAPAATPAAAPKKAPAKKRAAPAKAKPAVN